MRWTILYGQHKADSQYGSDSQTFTIVVAPLPPVDGYIDFNSQAITSFDPRQDRVGEVTISDNGLGLTLVGNRWVKIDFDYDITPETTLAFDYISTVEGEIHGIGLETDLRADKNRTFNIYGTQSWGLQSTRYTEFGQVQRIVIPVGTFYTGNVSYLYFVMDNDISNPTSNGTFSNVAIYEPGNEPDPDPDPAPDPDPVPDAIDFSQFTFSNYGTSQNPAGAGLVEVLEGGTLVRLSGNLWQKIEINHSQGQIQDKKFIVKNNS